MNGYEQQIDSTLRADDLRQSARDYRDPATSTEERVAIRYWWETHGIRNQFHALATALEIERGTR